LKSEAEALKQLEPIARDMSSEAVELAHKIMPILAGREPMVQSAALADLVSMHLAGMFASNHKGKVDARETRRMREGMFQLFCKAVWSLVPVNEERTRAMLEEKRRNGELKG
jgi:hypothetical protein